MSATIERISATEESILCAVAQYRFVTYAQLRRLGLSSHIREVLRKLSGKPSGRQSGRRKQQATLGKLDFGAAPGQGRLSVLYILTELGAEIASEATGETVEAPTSQRLFDRDYWHRVRTVDLHIAVRQWAARVGADVEVFDTYYDPLRSNAGRRRHCTTIDVNQIRIVPDAIARIRFPDNVTRLYALEMANNRRTEHVIKKLYEYVRALDAEAIERAYDYPGAARILWAFDDAEGLRLAARKAQGDARLRDPDALLLAKSLSEIEADFVGGWRRFIDGAVYALSPQETRCL